MSRLELLYVLQRQGSDLFIIVQLYNDEIDPELDKIWDKELYFFLKLI